MAPTSRGQHIPREVGADDLPVHAGQVQRHPVFHRGGRDVGPAKKNLDVILKELAATMEYGDGTWAGTLALDHTSINTQAAVWASTSGATV